MSHIAAPLPTSSPALLRGLDSRGICNRLLDLAEDRPVTNSVLQRLLYFSHGFYLVRTGLPLVYGYFEAWQSGPVHASAFEAFQPAGEAAIGFRALRRVPMTGGSAPIELQQSNVVDQCLAHVMETFGRLPPAQLIEMARTPGSPWSETKNKARTRVVLGMRISDSVILEKFRFHKLVVDSANEERGPYKDAPFT